MQKPVKRLGRGLQSLISAPEQTHPAAAPPEGDTSSAQPTTVPVDRIQPNARQPRRHIEETELQSLAQSIKQSGLIQPVVVRRKADDTFELIAGERRWRAATLAGLTEIPVVIREASDPEMAELALIENIFREDLNAIERATAYKQYSDEFSMSAEQIAERLAEDRTTVTNYMRLLDLPREVKDFVANGDLAMGHARCLLGIRNPETLIHLAKSAVQQGLSVRALEKAVREHTSVERGETEKPKPATEKRPQIRALEEAFVRSLSTKVDIAESRKKGSGKIVIHYYSLEDFDRISERLGVDLD